MTQEEKAKAYDEVRKKIAIRFGSNVADEIFSQFEMSEDEKIRKELLKHLREVASGKSLELSTTDYERWATWVEKQGEHANFRNKIQIGDKVTRNEDGVLVNLSQLNRVAKKDEKQGEQKPAEYNRETSIDLRDIVDNEANAIWEEESTDGCHLVIDSFNMFYGICMQIAEAVVDYKKPAWSEEDAKICGKCIDAASGYYSPEDKQIMKDWLRNLKDRFMSQPKQEWSEDDEAMWAEIADLLWEGYKQSGSKFSWDDIRNWVTPKLKSLRPQSTWKPSDEQMDALESATANCAYSEYQDCLRELIEQLKKLREK